MRADQGGNDLNELFNEIKLHEPIKKIEVKSLHIDIRLGKMEACACIFKT